MSIPVLTEARMVLLDHAMEPELLKELKDIILCAPSRVANKILKKDYEKLSKFIFLPRDAEGNINLKGAREEVANLMTTYPAFRSQNPITVCMLIATYFSEHPEQSNANPEQEESDWLARVTPTNSPNPTPPASPTGSPRMHSSMRLQQEQAEDDIL